MLKRMRRIGIFVLAVAVVISGALIASANEQNGSDNSIETLSTTSNYVIENKSKDRNRIKVTIEHHNSSNNKEKIYSDDVIDELSYGSKINDYAKALNWTVSYVMVNGQKATNPKYILLDKDSTVQVYYNAKTDTVEGATTFYDYVVKAGEETDENGNKVYYSFNQLGDEPINGQKITSGSSPDADNQNYPPYRYNEFYSNGKRANAWTGRNGGPVTGLLKGVDSNGKVEFNYPEPGFFVNEDAYVTVNGKEKYLRKVYKDYKLSFSQNGDTYQLASVKHDGNEVTKAGADFFPLDDVGEDVLNYEYSCKRKSDTTGNDRTLHNYFFGMRYDVDFKIGDYIGPLNYSFTGDDDLWVVLDGNQVVIDLGGTHDAASQTVNLWDYIDSNDKETTHTLTILYMERGAYLSNCQMNFTLPSARISEVSNVPLANMNFNKVNSQGDALTGAAFKLTLVNDEDKDDIYTSSSHGSEGVVSFDKLKAGTYTLMETMAPNGYVTSTEAWKVVVTEENGKAVARLYDSSGNEVKNHQIQNLSNDEYLNSSLELDKSAKVIDWDRRKYEITLSASSYAQKTVTPAPVDIVLVLDTSASMNFKGSLQKYKYCKVNDLFKNEKSKTYYYVTNDEQATVYRVKYNSSGKLIYVDDSKESDSDKKAVAINGTSSVINTSGKYQFYTTNDDHDRLYYLKQAATTFVNNLSEKSPDSRISIVTYNATVKRELDLQKIKDHKSSILDTINNLSTASGTKQYLGLQEANSVLQSSSANKYVVLLTDGCPNDKNDTNVNKYQTMIDEANNLKGNDNTTLMTVGVGLSAENSALNDAKNQLKDIASENGNSKYAYTVEANYLSEVFNSILGSITSDASITGATIKDYIDPRFIILDESGEEINSDYPNIEHGVSLSNGGTVYFDENGRQYIIWEDQGIGPKNSANNTPGWKRKITVKAKDDYIGGNDVTTNGADSGITVGSNTALFPQPKVNVKAEISITNKKVTIYKGDTIPSDEEILNTLLNSNYIGKYGIDISNFVIERSAAVDFENKVDSFTGLKPEKAIQYYVRISYNAGSPSEESNANTTLDGTIYHAGDDNYVVYAKNDGIIHESDDNLVEEDSYKDKQYGIYDIDVKSGKLTIVKKVDNVLSKDRTFSFKVTDSAGSEQILDVKVSKNKKEGSASLSDLSRDTYKVEEVVPSGYEVSDIKFVDSSTDSLNSTEDTVATITFGTDKSNNNVINNYKYVGKGVKGKLEVTNETVISNWKIVKVRKDDDKTKIVGAEFALKQGKDIKYAGVSNEDGYIVWSNGDANDVRLSSGEYVLEETKAAKGYAKGDTTWTLKVTKGGNLEYIKDAKGNIIDPKGDNEVNLYYFTNDVPYELPETGGIGIYWYMAAGMLLMFIAIVAIYRKRYNEYMNK